MEERGGDRRTLICAGGKEGRTEGGTARAFVEWKKRDPGKKRTLVLQEKTDMTVRKPPACFSKKKKENKRFLCIGSSSVRKDGHQSMLFARKREKGVAQTERSGLSAEGRVP